MCAEVPPLLALLQSPVRTSPEQEGRAGGGEALTDACGSLLNPDVVGRRGGGEGGGGRAALEPALRGRGAEKL